MQMQTQTTHRKTHRKQRLALTPQQRKRASRQAFRYLEKLPFTLPNCCHKPAKIGIYLDAFGELPVQPIIDWAKHHHFDLYLPVVIKPNTALKFVKMPDYQPTQWRLVKHALGMRQPANLRHAITVTQLDVLFMPLVAVDNHGYRMGMGGGFYDRTLAHSHRKPVKIGWAYDFQQVEALAVNPWDVRLDYAIFPSGLKRFKRYRITPPPASDFPDFTDNQELSKDLIAQVMQVERLDELLAQATTFGLVHSEHFF